MQREQVARREVRLINNMESQPLDAGVKVQNSQKKIDDTSVNEGTSVIANKGDIADSIAPKPRFEIEKVLSQFPAHLLPS